MISWIVASHDEAVLSANLLASLATDVHAHPTDELIVVRDAPSIADAYRDGQAQARNPVLCFVHHDVQVRVPSLLRDLLAGVCGPQVGMVGVIGSRVPAVPWWDAPELCGSVIDGRLGVLDYGPPGPAAAYPVAYLDGLLLAAAQPVEWESWGTWHLYDHDACQQMLDRGLTNWCLPGGKDLLVHNTHSPASTQALPGWEQAVAGFETRWGPGGGCGR